MGRHDGDERFGRTLRELLLKDVRERVGDDSDEDSQDCEHQMSQSEPGGSIGPGPYAEP